MKNKSKKTERLMYAMEGLIMKMNEVDDTCVRLSEDIEKRDLMVICMVGEHERVIMKEIAEFLDKPVSTTTGIVDKLVQKDYLSREFSPTDRRSIQVVLSEQGKSICGRMNTMKYKMAIRMLDELSEAESERFIRLLEKVTNGLQKYVPVD